MERTTARSFFQIPFLKKTSIREQKGFSLLELLIVMMIIGILLTIASFSYLNVQRKSRDGRRKADLEQVRSALETYRAQLGYYPNSYIFSPVIGWTDLSNLSGLLAPNYIAILPTDPQITYKYQYISTNLASGNYYGYCLSSTLETIPTPPPDPNSCGITLPTPTIYKYGVRQP